MICYTFAHTCLHGNCFRRFYVLCETFLDFFTNLLTCLGNPSTEGGNGNHPTVRDAIMKIRFLTLSPQQFAEVPASCNLLTESEKFAILMNICSPMATTPMPSGFSTSRIPRRRKHSRNESIFMVIYRKKEKSSKIGGYYTVFLT